MDHKTRIGCSFMFIVLMLTCRSQAVTVPFTSGPIPLCDTSTFTANVAGIGMLVPFGEPWGYTLDGLTINITTDHPQTLRILLTSPNGTELLLSEFNGAGGQNYTNCTFGNWGASITTGSAPFSGNWTAEGGPLSLFDYQNADGIWTVTVIDTSCANGGTGPGGNWTPGWYNGSSANGGFFMYFNNPPPPPCPGWIPNGQANICVGETFDILAYYTGMQPGLDYSISINGTPVPDPNAVSDAGYYWIEGYDPWDGCLYWAEFLISVSAPVPLGPDQVVGTCDTFVDLTTLFPSGSVSWSFNGSAITPSQASQASSAGVYQVISGGAGACSDTALVTLIIDQGPALGMDQAVEICAGSSIDLNALYPTNGLATSWTLDGQAIGDPVDASVGGTYVLSASDGTCSSQVSVFLSVNPIPELGADQVAGTCSDQALDLTTFFPSAGASALWTLNGISVDPTNVNTAGNYMVLHTDGMGCMDSAFVLLEVYSSPDLGPAIVAEACEGDVLDLSALFETGGYVTSWTLGGTPVDPTSVGTSGTYSLMVTSPEGCIDSSEVDVMFEASPTLGPDMVIEACTGVPVDLEVLYPTNAAQVSWEYNGTAVLDPGAVTQSGTYSVLVTSASGCMNTALVTLSLIPGPSLGPDQEASICDGSSLDLGAFFPDGQSGSWTLDGDPVTDPSAVGQTGTYRLVVMEASGCSDTAWFALTVDPLPSLGPDRSFALCPWQSLDLSSEFPIPAGTASFLLDGAAVSDPTAVQAAGVYVISVTDENGCADEAVATVVNIDCLCEADFRYEGACVQDPVQFSVLADSLVTSVLWSFNGSGPNSTGVAPIVQLTQEDVRVTMRAQLSCGLITVDRVIHVSDCSDSCSVWVPSAFTPDGDGINDTWGWQGECRPKDFITQVFDRWGELIYASSDPDQTWDGTTNGKRSQSGVYIYRMAFELPYQEPRSVLGSVTLVR